MNRKLMLDTARALLVVFTFITVSMANAQEACLITADNSEIQE